MKLLVEPVTLPLTWLVLARTNINANTLTAVGLLLSVIGCLIAITTSNVVWVVLGFMGFYICDFIDGPVAIGRGGGSYFGAVFDFFVDRITLLFSLLTLGWIHLLNGDYILVYLCFIYYAVYTQIDMNAFATLNAKFKYGMLSDVRTKHSPSTTNCHRTWLKGFQVPLNWVPRRLSSPVLGIVAYCLTSSYVVAYMVAFFALTCEYVVIALGLLSKFTKIK